MKIKKNISLDIHRAIIREDLKKVKELLKNKISPDKQTGNNNTPLHIAVMRKNISAIKLLHKYNANPNLTNSHGSTPLHIAANKKNNSKIIQLLIKMGTNINHTDRYGNTPLHLALRSHGDIKIIKLLLKSNANPNAINDDFETPLSIAKKYKNIPCIKLLRSYNAQATNKNISKLLKIAFRAIPKLKKIILISFSITIIGAAIAVSILMSEPSFMGIIFAILANIVMALIFLGEQYYKIRKNTKDS